VDYKILNQLRDAVHQTAKDKGWYSEELEDRNIGELLALIHSEVSEALEEWRLHRYDQSMLTGHAESSEIPNKPIGFTSEIADILIRVLDMCGYMGIDVAKAVQSKMEYNKTRQYRHGKHA
jgi:NTP pyrophosphatase (non-canonical NTP hydrolase)